MVITNENPELVIGLVSPVGVDISSFNLKLKDHIRLCSYQYNHIRLSALIKTVKGLTTQIDESSEYKRIKSLMTAGDEVRRESERNDFVAALGICSVSAKRSNEEPLYQYTHVFDSLKHPDEVQSLRNIYGDGFYLLGISSSRSNRLEYLKQKGMSQSEAEELIRRDESEEFKCGQHTRDTFHLADGFIDIDADNFTDQIARVIDLIFGDPCSTPTRDEYAMFLAFAASLRSSDLSRQVGAVVTSSYNEIISTGANDVPCPKGGLYWTEDDNDARDFKLGYDPNEKKGNEIAIKIMNKLDKGGESEKELLETAKEILKGTGIFDITEYGRSVHAEMEALISCARSGVSPRGGTLYCTTFPCHNCAKHIVASGISRVVFIEPYPKSRASELHPDSIYLANEEDSSGADSKVKFMPFVGIGPRRFIDLFSMNFGSGITKTRKINGETANWERSCSSIRVPLSPISYIERETRTAAEIDILTGGENENNKEQ